MRISSENGRVNDLQKNQIELEQFSCNIFRIDYLLMIFITNLQEENSENY